VTFRDGFSSGKYSLKIMGGNRNAAFRRLLENLSKTKGGIIVW
jgi:hypothetical protein